jgi:uncharacterized protein (TIGR02145 family)/prepilin-type N-terminal cleavage/methylation domain-containing protein
MSFKNKKLNLKSTPSLSTALNSLLKSIILNPKSTYSQAFTIVELLVVIVIIGILATITAVAYTGVSQRAIVATLQSDLSNAANQLKIFKVTSINEDYPTANVCPSPGATEICLKSSAGNSYVYTVSNGTNPKTFTLTATNGALSYQITNDSSPSVVVSSPYIQTITVANCPVTRTQVQDARDGHTYWIQQLADGKCWMLTNLGYAGGGTNTYGDTKTLINGTGGSLTYTVASYYVTPSTTNFTIEPTAPSTSTDGTGQYGYLYNWCGAMGGQATAACDETTTPEPVTTISICPAGWRLPTVIGGEFGALNTAINGGSTTTDAGLIGVPWLAQRGGFWYSGFYYQGITGHYWSSDQRSASEAFKLSFNSAGVTPIDNGSKFDGFSVRCIAD